MDPLIECIVDIVKSKGLTMESYIETTLDKSFSRLHKQGIKLGLMGQTVFPNLNEPTTTKGNDTYVPGLADVYMLGESYYTKDGSIISTSRGRDHDLMKKYSINPPPNGWYMSEKFDGQRALWDGSKFVTRGSMSSLPRVYPYVPDWFLALMPPGVPLDGEFYIGRDQFQEIGFLKSKLKPESERKRSDHTKAELDKKWQSIKYQVFDIPNFNKPFEERMAELKQLINDRCKNVWPLIPLPPYITRGECPMVYTEQIKVNSQEELDRFYTELVSGDAEGVMLRAPKIPYIPRRTKLLLKLKPEHEAEGVIVGYRAGEGKYQGMLGSFKCQMLNKSGNPVADKYFYVGGMNDTIRKDYTKSHPVGTIITYKYTFLTDTGIPRHPRYKAIRWENQ